MHADRGSLGRITIACLCGACIALSVPARADHPETADHRETAPRVPCPYATSHEVPLDAVADIVEEVDDYTKLRIEFNGIKADRVPAFLYLPKNGQIKHPAVLLQYGSGGDKKVDYIVALGRQFVRRGFAVLTIDAPGRGERKRADSPKRTIADWLFGGEGRDVFLQYCGDYSRAVDYLVSRPDVDSGRICYTGISWGAITGVTYVAHDARIKAMAAMVGGGAFLGVADSAAVDPPEGRASEKALSIDPVRHVGQIAPRPLLLLNVTRDQLVPRQFAEALHNAAGEGAKKVWLETDHYFIGVDRNEVGESVINFLKQSIDAREDE